jgi:hypothetical protein
MNEFSQTYACVETGKSVTVFIESDSAPVPGYPLSFDCPICKKTHSYKAGQMEAGKKPSSYKATLG